MTTFNYTTGNPSNLVAGGAASMTDIAGPFADVPTFLNGANIDATNLATSAKPVTLLGPYKTIADYGQCVFGSSAASGLNVLAAVMLGSGAVSGNDKMQFYFDPADYAVSGLSLRLRIRATVVTNAVDPTKTLTFGLYPITASAGSAGSGSITLGTVVSGSATSAANPGASAQVAYTGSDFAAPTAGLYSIGCVTSGVPATNSMGHIDARLEYHHV